MPKSRKRSTTQPGLRGEFHTALDTATLAVGRLATLSRTLPDKEDCHRLRNEISLIILRLANLRALALRWPA